MTIVENESVVGMIYELTDVNGELIESVDMDDPLVYLQGVGNIIPGLEKAMIGKKIGDHFKVTIQPEDGYGVISDTMVQAVPKSEFGPDVDEVQVGMQFQVENDEGDSLLVTAIEIRENEIVLDGNHPLAGKTLNFEIEVIAIRKATENELKIGYPEEQKTCNNDGCC